MGARRLRSWLERPLLSVQDIDRRADCVERLVNDTVTREELMRALSGIGDMERLMSRIVYGSAGGRDLVALRMAMEKLPAVKELLAAFPKGRLRELYRTLDYLNKLLHEYICCAALADWMIIANTENKASAATWAAKAEEAQEQVTKIINLRRTRVRRTISPI